MRSAGSASCHSVAAGDRACGSARTSRMREDGSRSRQMATIWATLRARARMPLQRGARTHARAWGSLQMEGLYYERANWPVGQSGGVLLAAPQQRAPAHRETMPGTAAIRVASSLPHCAALRSLEPMYITTSLGACTCANIETE